MDISQRVAEFKVNNPDFAHRAHRITLYCGYLQDFKPPPVLPFLVSLVCHLRRAKCILRIDDVYPETLIATGMLGQRNIVAKVFCFMNKILCRSFDRIVVLGRDMDQLVKNKLGRSNKHVTIIPNWADVDLVKPTSKANNVLLRELGLTDKFIIQRGLN